MSSQTALVTGASSGFGLAIARQLDQAGYQLILIARRQDRLEELAASLSKPAHIICCDVRDREQILKELAGLPEGFSRIDVLVNNAGLALGMDTADKSDWQDWQTMIETNVMALSFMTRQLLPGMIERNRGHIVNMGSTAALHAYKGGHVYGASKAFVDQFSMSLRADLLGTLVRVTNVIPGLAGGTEFSNVRFHGDDQAAEKFYANCQPLEAQDVANAVLWVLQQPPHVNVNRVELMPICQASAGLSVYKEGHGVSAFSKAD